MEQFLFYGHGVMLSSRADAEEEDGGCWRCGTCLPGGCGACRAAAAAEPGRLPASGTRAAFVLFPS